jgi:hypothetical protein
MIRLWQPDGLGWDQELIIPQSAMKILSRMAPHEIGHAETAIYFGGRVLGIALEPKPEGVIAQAIYETPEDLSIEDRCTIFAAGSAGESLAFGKWGIEEASGDQKDIISLDCPTGYEELVQKATAILQGRRLRFDRLSHLLRKKVLYSDIELMIGDLPMGKVGAFLLKTDDFR